MSEVRHVLHAARVPENGEWRAWCCCGWKGDTWLLKETAGYEADVHMAAVNSGYFDRTAALVARSDANALDALKRALDR